MLARVKSDYRWQTVRAFAGLEYVKNEYRAVPAEYEEVAKLHPALEFMPDAKATHSGVTSKIAVASKVPEVEPEGESGDTGEAEGDESTTHTKRRRGKKSEE